MASSTSTLELMDLPFEIICHIITFLSEDDIFWNLGFTCKTLLEICLDNVDVITVSFFYVKVLCAITRQKNFVVTF